MIVLTDFAQEKIREIAESEGIEYLSVRAKILGGGCNGWIFDFIFDHQINDLDEVFEFNGIKLIIDQLSLQYLENITIDYLEETFGGGFKFTGSDIKNTCGCGKSVSY